MNHLVIVSGLNFRLTIRKARSPSKRTRAKGAQTVSAG